LEVLLDGLERVLVPGKKGGFSGAGKGRGSPVVFSVVLSSGPECIWPVFKMKGSNKLKPKLKAHLPSANAI